MAKINQYPAKTVPSNNDEFVLHDPSSGSTKKMTRGDLIGGAPLPANSVTLPAINGGTTAGTLVTDASGVVSIKSPKIGIIPASTFSSNGVKNITGIGFKPSLVKFTGMYAQSTTNNNYSTGLMNRDGQQYHQYATSSGGTNARGSGNNAAYAGVASGTTTVVHVFKYTSMNDDGFSIESVTNTAPIDILYEAYP